MKTKFFSATTLLICCVAVCLAVAADLTGKWTGNLKTPDGTEVPLNFTFKVDGTNLTGALQSPQGDIPLSDGKINGSDFTFKIDFNGTPIANTGKYYVDSVAIDSEVNGGKFHTVLKRATN